MYDNKGYLVFALIFGVIGGVATLGAVALLILAYQVPQIFEFIGSSAEVFIKDAPYVILSASAFFAINMAAFLLPVINEKRGKLRRWHIIVGLLASIVAAGSIIGIAYTVFAIKALITADFDEYEDEDAHKGLIITPIIFGVLSIPLIVLPCVLTFPQELMSVSMWLGICFLCILTTLPAYLSFGPNSRINWFLKVLILIGILGALTGIYFLFEFILKNDVSRYGGDWPTIQRDIIAAVSTFGFLNLLYFIYGATKKDYTSYIYSLEISLGVAVLVMILANWLAFYWLVLIEFILYLISFIFILKFIGAASAIVGPLTGADYSSSETSETYTVTDDNGREHTLEYQGGGHYKDDDGNTWTSDDGGSTVYLDND